MPRIRPSLELKSLMAGHVVGFVLLLLSVYAMPSLGPFFSLIVLMLSAYSTGRTSCSAAGGEKSVMGVLAGGTTIGLSFFLSYSFLSNMVGLQDSTLVLFSLCVTPITALFGWGSFELGRESAGREEALKTKVIKEVEAALKPTLNHTLEKITILQNDIKKSNGLIKQLDDSISRLVNEHGAVVSAARELNELHSELRKQVTELKSLHDKLDKALSEKTHVALTVAPEKPAFAPRKLTREEGLEARLSGEAWQERSAEFFRGLGLEVLNNFKHTKPDHILYRPRTKGPVAVVAVKSYKLLPYTPTDHRHASPQRTITPALISAEFNAAKRQKTALIIEVVNKVTDTMWFYIVPHRQLDSFCRVTTPSWLAQNPPPNNKLEENYKQLTHFLKSTLT